LLKTPEGRKGAEIFAHRLETQEHPSSSVNHQNACEQDVNCCWEFFIDLQKGVREVAAWRFIDVSDIKISAVHTVVVGTLISGMSGRSKDCVQLLQLSLGRLRRSGAIIG
jgi:sugar (pentulose or hexulose) kinase